MNDKEINFLKYLADKYTGEGEKPPQNELQELFGRLTSNNFETFASSGGIVSTGMYNDPAKIKIHKAGGIESQNMAAHCFVDDIAHFISYAHRDVVERNRRNVERTGGHYSEEYSRLYRELFFRYLSLARRTPGITVRITCNENEDWLIEMGADYHFHYESEPSEPDPNSGVG